MKQYLEVGLLNNTHGVRGEMKLTLWCDDLDSVSYTHLDVYKRQTIDRRILQPCFLYRKSARTCRAPLGLILFLFLVLVVLLLFGKGFEMCIRDSLYSFAF